MSKPAVIVVNSHVARGSVGGRASVFGLERLGFPVWSVPTIVLSWHPGHGPATRFVPAGADFAAVLGDLARAAWLPEVGAMLAGYLGDVGQVGAIAELVGAVKGRQPGTLFLCDPVIGDSTGLFRPEPLARAIGDRLLPLADIATLNRHELDWLARQRIADNDGLAGCGGDAWAEGGGGHLGICRCGRGGGAADNAGGAIPGGAPDAAPRAARHRRSFRGPLSRPPA
ncbi:MAG: hypothetical protein WDM84_06470 [Bauldia sp.]